MVICVIVGRCDIVAVLGGIIDMKMGYDVIFYKTIGGIDSVLSRMIGSLLGVFGDDICIYRNDDRYVGCPLVISFNNSIFVDVKFSNGYFYSVKEHLVDGMISFSNILNNSYGVDDEDYEYVRIVFCNGFSSLVKRSAYIECDGVYNGFRVLFFDYRLAYNEYMSNFGFSSDIVKWLSLLNLSDFSLLSKFSDIITDDEIEKIKFSIDSVSRDMDIVNFVEKMEDEWDKCSDIYDEIIRDYSKSLVKRMISYGLDEEVVFDILEIKR